MSDVSRSKPPAGANDAEAAETNATNAPNATKDGKGTKRATKNKASKTARITALPGVVSPAVLEGVALTEGLTMEGGMRPLGLFLRENDRLLQPQMALWLDSADGTIRASRLITPDDNDANTEDWHAWSIEAALDTLREGLLSPAPVGEAALEAAISENEASNRFRAPGAQSTRGAHGKRSKPTAKETNETVDSSQQPQPGLPTLLRVNQQELADAARRLLGPLGVRVEFQEHLPAFEDAYASLAEALGATPDGQPPQPFEWQIDGTLLAALFKAINAYWRRAPWEYVNDYPPLMIDLGVHGPQPGVEKLYTAVIGSNGEVYGVVLYYEAEAVRRLAERSRRRAEVEMSIEIDDAELDQLLALLRQNGFPVDALSPDAAREVVRAALQEGIAQETLAENEDEDDPAALIDDCLTCFLTPQDECDPSYLEWLARHALKTPARDAVPVFQRLIKGGGGRQPNERETQAMWLALEALNRFLSNARRLLESDVLQEGDIPLPLTYSYKLPVSPGAPATAARGKAKRASASAQPTVQASAFTVSFPAEGYSFDDPLLADFGDAPEPDTPPTPEALSTRYTFKVTFPGHGFQPLDEPIWRRIELSGDQTLDDLHNAIQEAFGWDDDHLYAFFMNNRAWSEKDAYYSPRDEDEQKIASQIRLHDLKLRTGKKFMYLFDFGDELRHTVLVEAVVRNGVQPEETYPRIVERHGENVQQYPYAEDNEEESEEDGDDDALILLKGFGFGDDDEDDEPEE